MKRIVVALSVAAIACAASWATAGGGETVIHVKADASGNGSGTNWMNAVTTLAAALNLVDAPAGRTNIWICGDLAPSSTPSVTAAVSICGGFTGTESSPSERVAGSRSAINGGGTLGNVISITASSGTVLLDSLVVSNGLSRCLYHSGNASLTIRDSYIGSIPSVADCTGHGISASGSASSSVLTLDGVTMQEVRDATTGRHPWGVEGLVMRVVNFKEVVFTNCVFRENGVGKSVSLGISGRENNPHSFYFSSAPLHAVNCKFIGNRTPNHDQNKGGSLVGLYGNGSGSYFRNCLFAANCTATFGASQNYRGCCVNVEMGAAANTCGFESCTFAYNVCGTGYTAGILGTTGTMTINNCIFYGNVVSSVYGQAADLYLRGAAATANVSYTWFTSDFTVAAGPGSLNTTAGTIFTGDPLFATGTAAFLSDYLVSGTKAIPASAYNCTINGYAGFDALDLHLRSNVGRWNGTTWVVDASLSPAIDAGDPASDDSREPDSKCINLGFYGNTAEASKPSPLAPEIANVAFIQPDETYLAQFTVTMGGTNGYSATTYLCYGLSEGSGLSGWDHMLTFAGSESGSVHQVYVPEYHTSGMELKWRVYSVNKNGDDEKTGTFTYAGASPSISAGSVNHDHYYTWPRFSASMTGDGTVAEVYLCYGTSASGASGTNDWDNVVRVDIVKKSGDTIEASAIRCAAKGTLYYYRWVAIAEIGTNQTSILQTTVTGTEPPGFPYGLGEGWVHVWEGAKGFNDGSDWANACTNLVSAAAVASAEKLKIAVSGRFTNSAQATFTVPIEMYGGFTATENDLGSRPDDGSCATIYGKLASKAFALTASSGTLVLDRIEIDRCLGPAVKKTGNADIVVRDCRFLCNGGNTSCWGAGLQLSGSASASAALVTNCCFLGNSPTGEGGETTRDHSGMGLSLNGFLKATVADCHFVTNGPPSGNPSGGRSGTRGGSLRIANAKTLVKGCGFVGNRVISHGDGPPVYVGGTVAVSDSSGGSVFQNCAFVGNEAYGGTGNGASAGVLVYLNSDTATCAFTNCTFAYNGSYMGNGGALCVYRGKTYVRNSIFHGDVVAATQTFINWGGPYTGHELYVSKAVSTSPSTGIEVDYSILPSLESPYVVDGADLGRVLLGGNVGTADPLLMTNACAITISSQIPSFAIKPVGINFHLQGKGGYLDEITGERVTRLAGGARAGDSPAIAAGDPLSDCSKQPSGKRVNLGFYGNTPWASVAVGQQFLLIIR